jgi:A/G-specific adenine glycosylase
VSEIMLQQTRVETVTPYFDRFVARWPTPLALAEASADEVLSAWSGLGYYRRARLLHAGAKAIAARGRGNEIPRSREGLLALPGIGRYTAGAIASIAFGEAVGLVDGNVARVFARLFALEDDMKGAGMRRAERIAEALVPADRPGDFNQALMELGATVCTPQKPRCEVCPLALRCRARAEGRVLELPVLAPKAAPKPARLQAIVVRSGGRVLLGRRPEGGLFGGLWEPPARAGTTRARGELLRGLGVDPASVERRGTVTHVLSHRRLTIDVHAAELPRAAVLASSLDGYEALGFFDEAALDQSDRIGLATLARKVLAASRGRPERSRSPK